MTRQKRSTYVDDLTIRTVADQAAVWTGYQPESVSEAAVRRVLRAELVRGSSLDVLRQRAADRDPSLVAAVSSALTVGETYFFRYPEQFDAVAHHAAQLVANGHRVLRAWCAGCSTGEEAYSLAATLLAIVGANDDAPIVDIVATDVQPGALEVARRAAYRGSSIRPSGPLLHPVLVGPDRAGEFHVLERVRARVSFALHDLRDPPPGNFELIMCRNVLLYFSRTVARSICARLSSALSADGLLAFGTMDVEATDVPGLVRASRPELQLFTQRRVQEPAISRPRDPPVAPASVVDPIDEIIAAHRAVLVSIERGNTRDATRALDELNRRFPAYLPGLLERALHEARQGNRAAAFERMCVILDRACELEADETIVGVEALPASFYATTAREFISRHSRDGTGRRPDPQDRGRS